ncbi:MAG: 50S ribosomal protein L11 methyltransferase [Candidatus Methylomirabilales bacterium]
MIHVGSRLCVASYRDPVLSADDILVLIRPSTAFGDGNHATTQMCLEMLECEIGGGELVLDLGTGSGVLAIAAARLGARKVIAVDTARHACKAASVNIPTNDVEQTVHVLHGSVEALHPDKIFDVIVTNLYNAEQVRAVLPEIARRVRGRGMLICGGIWMRRDEEMIRLLADEHFAVRTRRTMDDYVTIAAVKEA